MGVVNTVLGLVGFGWGLGFGVVTGYFLFIYLQPTEVKDPIIAQLGEMDETSLEDLMDDIPLWVKNPDYDRVDWLNRFLKDMWPYLDKAICKIIRETAQPYFEEYGQKYKLEAIEFESLTLGTLPPTFVGMKVFDTKEKEMIMEPSIKFAGNPNIIVAVKAFGMKATVQLVDFQLSATARVTLKPLIPSFPCFSTIFISLMNKPQVDFGLKVLGGDIMAIPGLYRFVQDYISNMVARMYMWPERLQHSVSDDPSAAKKPVGIIEVTIIKAKNLVRKDTFGKSDPYVKIQLVNTLLSKKTTHKPNTLNPVWNEVLKLTIQDPKTQSLELQVFDYDKVGGHERMGVRIVPLSDLVENVSKVYNLELFKNMDPNDEKNKKFRGEITFEIIFKPFKDDNDDSDDQAEAADGSQMMPEGSGGGLLTVTIVQAEGLEGKHHNNPFVELHFKGEKKKTPVVKKNREPRWDAEFTWNLEEAPENEQLHLEVHSKGSSMNMVHRQEFLGHADISLRDLRGMSKRINETYTLVDGHGKIQVVLDWQAV